MSKSSLLTYEKELKSTSGKRWLCQPCEPKGEVVKRPSVGAVHTPSKNEYTLNDVMDKLCEMDSKYNSLLEKFEEQALINEKLMTKIQQLEIKIARLEQQDSHTTPIENTKEAIQEISEREYRKKNLMLFGVDELNSDEPEERKAHDMDITRKILEAACPEVIKDGLKVYRIGKREQGKTRPVKVLMETEEDVKKVIKKAVITKTNKQFAKLAFSTDKTKQQLAQYKLVREELKRRSVAGEENLKIRYVKGEPRIIKLKN